MSVPSHELKSHSLSILPIREIFTYHSQFTSNYIHQVHLKRSGEEGTVRHISANACLTPLVSLHGMAVTTVEGIGSTK